MTKETIRESEMNLNILFDILFQSDIRNKKKIIFGTMRLGIVSFYPNSGCTVCVQRAAYQIQDLLFGMGQ